VFFGFQITSLFLCSSISCITHSLLHSIPSINTEPQIRRTRTGDDCALQLCFVRSWEATAWCNACSSRLAPLHCVSSLWCERKRPPSERTSRCVSRYQHFATDWWHGVPSTLIRNGDTQQVWTRLKITIANGNATSYGSQRCVFQYQKRPTFVPPQMHLALLFSSRSFLTTARLRQAFRSC
jgi:hypothetical protein